MVCEFHGKRNAEAGAAAASLHMHVAKDAPTDSIIPYTLKSLADDFVSLAKHLGCVNTIVGGHDW
jgi:pimeloyl-ACP methyl ester carboxylesterase